MTLREIIERLERIALHARGRCEDCGEVWETDAADALDTLRLDLEIAERREREQRAAAHA